MKCKLLFLLFAMALLSDGAAFAQVTDTSAQWTWIKGSSLSNQNGTYGTQGVPGPLNTPGGRVVPMVWTDKQGKFWLFGGDGRGATGSTNYRQNDLWKYDPATGNWVWLKGTNTPPQAGNYGAQGVSAVTNVPGGRSHAGTWVDTAGNLWLYGGIGYSTVTTATPRLNDLWKYNPVTNEWTWMRGSQGTTAVAAVWGTPGVSAPANNPGSRSHMVTWADKNGKLWLFGGYHAAAPAGYLNDLWRYDPVTNEWTWMKGSNSTATPISVYGTLGVEDPGNTPGGLSAAVIWTDASDNAWMFGGFGQAGTTTAGVLGALWKYNPATNNWTWIKGGTTINNADVFGTLGVADTANRAGGIYSAYGWKDVLGKFWMFGGYHYNTNDFRSNLWRYDPATNAWTWMKGPGNVINEAIVYGTQGVRDPANKPGARYNIALQQGWTDTAGNFWMFGGSPRTVYLNDLWQLSQVTPPSCLLPTPVIVASGAVSFCQGDSVVLRGTVSGSGISYRWLQGAAVLSGETDDSLVVYNSGAYSVEASNGTCADTSNAVNVTVYTPPVSSITASGPASFCQGDSVILMANPSGAGYIYHWLKDTIVTGSGSDYYKTTVSGHYRVAVTNSNNCTDTSADITVTAHPLPVVSLTLSGPASFCQGDSVVLDAGAGSGWGYVWKQDALLVGGNMATHTAGTSGIYKVLVTDANNCKDSAETAIRVYPVPVVTVTPADTAFCQGGRVQLEAMTLDTGLSWQWKDAQGAISNATAPFLQVMQTGSYYVVAGSLYTGNCTDSSGITTVTVYPLPEPIISRDGSELHTESYYAAYQWYIDGQPVAGAIDSVLHPVRGTYVVAVTDSNGCSNMSDPFPVTDPGLLGNEAVDRLVKIYPNPVGIGGMLRIDAPVSIDITLSSMEGKVLLREKDVHSLDLNRLPGGIYVLRITDGKGRFIRNEKIVKEGRHLN